MSLSAKLGVMLEHLFSVLFQPGSIFSLASLATAFCIAQGFLAYRRWRRRGRVRLDVLARAVFSKRIMFHRSTFADMGYFLVNIFAIGGLIGWACLSGAEIAKTTLAAFNAVFGPVAPSAAPEFALRTGMTLLFFLAYEFGYWVDHYLKHRVSFLWEMHKTHHAAEVLTPWTVWRVHPLDTLVFTNIIAVVVGIAAGAGTWAIGREAPAFAFDGTNVLLVFFVYAYVHLQHSQFWIPFGGALGRVFMSPAHHQIHHSNNPAHFNRNMGSCLALWDWMFGTLEVPGTENPHLVYGVDQEGEDPQAVTTLLISPVRKSLAALIDALLPKPAEAPSSKAVAADK
jgi:sterol desaturase/sphingolipid hydroxylase (fatty acid hydroxylase superfamily)